MNLNYDQKNKQIIKTVKKIRVIKCYLKKVYRGEISQQAKL